MINIQEDYSSKKDEELVELTLQNPETYYFLMKRYEDRIARYIFRISGVSKEDGEDLVQDVFLSAYKNINDFDRRLKFSSWLYRIAHNKTISFWRKMKIRPPMIGSEDDELLKTIASSEDIAKDLDHKYTAAEIKKILDRLDEKYREVLVLKFIESKDYQEISDILEKPLGTVGTLISRAKEKFRELSLERGVKL